MSFCGASTYMRHRKTYFCGACWMCATEMWLSVAHLAICATESHISVAHSVLVRHRISKFCGACKPMCHKNIFCGARLFGAPQNVVPPIASFLVVRLHRPIPDLRFPFGVKAAGGGMSTHRRCFQESMCSTFTLKSKNTS